jgi:hypothetical protein
MVGAIESPAPFPKPDAAGSPLLKHPDANVEIGVNVPPWTGALPIKLQVAVGPLAIHVGRYEQAVADQVTEPG